MSMMQENRLQYLVSKLVSLQVEGSSAAELGNLALEILLLKSQYQQLESATNDTSSKEDAKKFLNQLAELEKKVVSLYLLSKLSKERSKKNPLMDYTRRYRYIKVGK